MRRRAAAAAALAAAVLIAHPAGATRELKARGGERQGLEPPEDFSSEASRALGDLSAEFGRFRDSVASRAAALTAQLQEQEHRNHDLERSNAQEAQAVEGVRRGNDALRARARALIAGNEELRAELREAGRRLQEAQDFSLQSVEGSNASEVALLAGVDAPPPATLPAPEAPADPVTTGTEARHGEVVSQPATMAPAQAPGQVPTQAPRPMQAQPTQAVLRVAPLAGRLEGDVGYAEAFASGDVDGSSDDGEGESEDLSPWQSLLALGSQHSRSLRAGRSLAGELPKTADAFAKLEKESVGKVHQLFLTAQRRLRRHRAELAKRQGSLNATRETLEATHSRLSAVVGELETTHKHLEVRSQHLFALLQQAAGAAHAAEARAAAALAAARPVESPKAGLGAAGAVGPQPPPLPNA
mmetsp:Transcript_49155/g.154433  ORF Transcript_49155/g.154433 Transcript_49155/m.154433 type:complete len:414 (+) Transcript_49155:53-1294(+)